MRPALHAACLAALALAGCSTSLASTADSQRRIDQLAAIAGEGGETRVPSVIASLRSDDPLVRRQAQRTLLQLTGTTNGFDWAAPRPARDEAIGTWEAWCRRRGLVVPAETTPHA